jgi:hypothetical protein
MSANKYASAIQKELSKKPTSAALEAEWRNVVLELGDSQVEKVPPGWLTGKQTCELLGLSSSRGRDLISKAVENKTVAVRIFRIRCRSVIRNVPHYKPVKPLKRS